MRRILALCLLFCSHVYAEENPAIACYQQLATETRFAPIANKIPISNFGNISFEMLALKAKPTEKDSKLIAKFAKEQNSCFSLGLEYLQKNLPPEEVALVIEGHNRIIAVLASLSNREFSYGTGNKQIQSIADDLRNKLTLLLEQMKQAGDAAQAAQQQEKDRQMALQKQQKWEEDSSACKTVSQQARAQAEQDADSRSALIMAFGALAGRSTMQPNTSAMNNMTATMKGQREGQSERENKMNNYASSVYKNCMNAKGWTQ